MSILIYTMKNLLLSIFVFFTSFVISQCTHTIRLTDTFGDGWNGGYVSVSVNGVVVLNNITLISGYGPATYTFSAGNGQIIRVYRTVSGTWPSEMRIQVLNSVGTTLIGVIQPVAGTVTSLGVTCLGSCGSSIPSNNLVCNATSISCGQTLNGTTLGATMSGYGEGGSCGTVQSYPGVWYKVTGNGQIMTASLCGTAWDSKISVFAGTCSSLSCVGGMDDNGPACAGTSASYSWNSVNGTIYWILVFGYSSNSNFLITLNCVNPPTPGPCTNTTAYGTQFMPVLGGVPYESVYCQFAGEYSTWYNAISNTPYVVTSSVGSDWITVRQGVYNGTVLATGTAVVNFTPNITGALFIHVNTNDYCAVQSSCRDIAVSRISALPVELLYLEGDKENDYNLIRWATATEHNTSHFVVEKSEDGYEWNSIGQVTASQNSNQEIKYNLIDQNVKATYNYYRLKQYDIDGINQTYGPIQINNNGKISNVIRRINLAGQEVNENTTGVVIEIYDDGSIKKIIK